jgi:hypothetical protein
VITLLPVAWRFGKASRIGVAIAGTDADHYGQVPHAPARFHDQSG